MNNRIKSQSRKPVISARSNNSVSSPLLSVPRSPSANHMRAASSICREESPRKILSERSWTRVAHSARPAWLNRLLP